MRKKAIVTTLVTLLFSVVVAVLRQLQLNSIFDADTGLADENALVTIVMAVVLAIAAIILIYMSVGIFRATKPQTYTALFAPHSAISLSISFLCGLAIAFAGVYYQVVYLVADENTVTITLLSFFAAIGGICLCALSISSLKRKDGAIIKLSSILPIFFFCMLLIRIYMINAANPVLLDYAYSILAVCCLVLAFYYNSGFAFGFYKPGRFVLFSELGVILSITSILESDGPAMKLFFGAAALYLVVNVYLFLSNLDEKYKRRPRNTD